MAKNGGDLSFWEHLDELRSALVRIICAGLVCGVVAFIFKEWLFDFILAPSKSDFITYRLLNKASSFTGVEIEAFKVDMINTALAQQFIIHMKTAFIMGLLGASPYIIYCLMHFIAPALYSTEKRLVFGVVGCGYAMFAVGLALSYLLIFPLTFRFLGTYQVSEEVVNMISLESYISTLTGMSLMMGIVFELPLICWMLAKMRILEASFMRSYRKHAIVAILIVAAIITPTSDAFTLALVSLPMWLLYEVSIGVVSHTNKNKIENE